MPAFPALAVTEAPAATEGELALAHTPDYIGAVLQGTLSPAAQREIGFPWSERMVARSLRSVGATIAAARAALAGGVALHLAGGTHHAYADKGSGYCVFNDVVVAARLMQAEVFRHRRQGLRVWVIDRPPSCATMHRSSPCRCMAPGTSRSARSAATWMSTCPTVAPTPPIWRHWTQRWPRPGSASWMAAGRPAWPSTWPVPTRTRATAWGA
jgi:hypothetical protein